jgi:hypothetical protein
MTRRTSFVFFVFVGLLPGLALVETAGTPVSPKNLPKVATASLPIRPVTFGHAVVPSGITSVLDLAEVIAREPKLYRGFELRHAQKVTVKENFWAYTSYRKNGRIYFTKNPVLILAGETIFTDGNILIRARCGNEISIIPSLPTSPEEPPDTELLVPPSAEIPFEPIPVDFPVPTNPVLPPTETPITPLPIIPIVPTLCCAAIPVTSEPPLPSPTPEPESLVLLTTGLIALVYRSRDSKRER